jgi:hypothetical protein
MVGKSYQLNAGTIGLSSDSHRIAVLIPFNAIVTVRSGTLNGHTVEVIWDGKVVTIFVEDLHARGELVV